jgi:hypothetical protein
LAGKTHDPDPEKELSMRGYVLTAAIIAVAAAPLAAQRGGTLEIGAVGKWTHFDNSFSPSGPAATAWGASVRLGLFLNRHWELELDDAQNFGHAHNFFKGFPSTTLNYYPHHLRVVFNQGMGFATWILSAGPAYNSYGKVATTTEPGFKGHDWGVAGLTGFRFKLTRTLALRVDGMIDYIPSPNNGKPAITGQFQGITAGTAPDKNVNLGVQAGLAVLLGHMGKD